MGIFQEQDIQLTIEIQYPVLQHDVHVSSLYHRYLYGSQAAFRKSKNVYGLKNTEVAKGEDIGEEKYKGIETCFLKQKSGFSSLLKS